MLNAVVVEQGGAPLGLEGRVAVVERGLAEVRAIADAAHIAATEAGTAAREAAENTRELLNLANAAKGVTGFLTKHGPRLIAFGVGIASTLGVGNPALLHFLKTFFA